MRWSLKYPDARESNALVVYPARLKLIVGFAFLLVAAAVAADEVYGFPPTFHLSFGQVIGFIVLIPLTAASLVCLVGTFSPLPLFSISHEGIRTYSLFGLFGSTLIPWAHVTSFVVNQSGGEQVLRIYSDNRMPIPSWSLSRLLLKRMPDVMRVWVSSGMIAGSMDRLLERLEQRFGREIDEHGVKLIDGGVRE